MRGCHRKIWHDNPFSTLSFDRINTAASFLCIFNEACTSWSSCRDSLCFISWSYIHSSRRYLFHGCSKIFLCIDWILSICSRWVIWFCTSWSLWRLLSLTFHKFCIFESQKLNGKSGNRLSCIMTSNLSRVFWRRYHASCAKRLGCLVQMILVKIL